MNGEKEMLYWIKGKFPLGLNFSGIDLEYVHSY